MKTKTLTVEEHEKIALMLKVLNARLVESAIERSYEEGKCNPTFRMELKIDELLSKARCLLEELMVHDYPDVESVNVYYGKRPRTLDVIKIQR